MSILLQQGEIALGAKEIRMLSRQESKYPQLTRLCCDFDFHTLEVITTEDDMPIKRFLLAAQSYPSKETQAITPGFAKLSELEKHVNTDMVNILHDYLFGEDSAGSDIQIA